LSEPFAIAARRHSGAAIVINKVNMPPETRPTITPRFVLGVFLVLMGIALTLDQLGVVPAHHMMRFWPVVLIVLGVTILQRGRMHGAVSGLVLIIVGSWLLLNTLGIVGLQPWQFLWPLILVVIGARIIMRAGRESRGSQSEPPGTEQQRASPAPSIEGCTVVSDHASVFSVLSGCRRRWGRTTFRSAEATCVMGGCDLDLRSALMGSEGTAQIEVFVLMGGINIFVPPNWTVVMHVTPFLGGTEDKTHTIPSTQTQTLTVHGTVVMGGMEISN
jgi:predicted membrane protein